jgi:hypothetical protein
MVTVVSEITRPNGVTTQEITIDILIAVGTLVLHTVFWSENLKGRDNFENLGVDERITFKMYLETYGLNLLASG